MSNHYSGSVKIEPPLNPEEFEFLKKYLQVLKEYRSAKKNSDKSQAAQTQKIIENFLGFPIDSKQAFTFSTGYCPNLELFPDKLECLDIYIETSFLKQSLETLNLFFFQEQLLVHMLELDFFEKHKISGFIKGTSAGKESWFYEITPTEIYNIENKQRVQKPRTKKEYFDSWREKILLLQEISKKTEKSLKKVHKI